MQNAPDAATTTQAAPQPASQTDPAGSPNLPPVGEYREAFAAIDDLPSSGLSGNPDPPRQPKPAEADPEPKEKGPPKEPAEKPAPSKEGKAKRRLPDDIDGLVNPKTKTEPDTKPVPEKIDDSEFEAESVPKRLREQYKMTRAELEKREARIKELEESTERVKKDTSDSVRGEYEKRLAEVDRRRVELESEVRFLDYTKSSEYREKYFEPLKAAWGETLAAIEGMTVTDSEGTEREVTSTDISQLLALPNPQARKLAHEMFGTAAPEIMNYRARLMRLTADRDKALDEWKKNGSEREKQMLEQRAEMIKTWEGDVKGYQEDYPELFGPKDGDAEGNEYLKQGYSLARKAFLAEGVKEGLSPELRMQEVLGAQTALTLRAMAYPRMLRDLNKTREENEALKAKLKEYEGSEPDLGGKPNRGEPGRADKDRSAEEMIDAIPGSSY